MQKTRKLIAMLLAVLTVLSMCTIGMMSVSALPEGAIVNDAEGNDASSIDGELYGLMGDSDSNGKVNVKDATQIQKAAAKILTLDETAEALADVDQNGKVNVKDATAIQKWAAKIKVDMPINCLVYFPKVETTPVATTTAAATTAAPTVAIPTIATVDEPEPATTKVTIPVIVIPTTVATEPTEAPATTVEPTEATKATDPTEPVATTAKPTEAPATTAKPTEAPATTVKPTEAPATTAKPTEAPATTVKPTEAITTATAAVTTAPATQPTTEDDGMITVYFTNAEKWPVVKIHAWTADGDVTKYPGVEMNKVKTNSHGQDVYSYDVPANVTGVMFTGYTTDDHSDYSLKTVSIKDADFKGDGYGYYCKTQQSDKRWLVESYKWEGTTVNTTASTAATTVADDTTKADDTTLADGGMITVYFTNAEKWPVVKIHAWTADGDVTKYPGVEMNKVKTNSHGQDVYSYDVPANVTGVMFTGYTTDDHSDYSLKTVSIKDADFKGDGYGYYCKTQQSDKSWLVESYKWEGTTVNTSASTAATTVADTTAKTTTEATDPTETEPASSEATTPAGNTFTVYFTNSKNWDVVNIHCWNSKGAITTWPGAAMTYHRTNGSGQDIYKYEVPAEAESIGFNGFVSADNTSDRTKQTVTITGDALKAGYGYYVTSPSNDGRWNVASWEEGNVETTTAATEATTKATDPTEPKPTEPKPTEPSKVESSYFLRGTLTDWTTGKVMYLNSDGSASITLKLAAGTYTFKIYDSKANKWYGNGGTIENTATGWTFSDAGDCTLLASGGTYTFKCYTNSAGKFKVDVTAEGVDPDATLPTVPQVDTQTVYFKPDSSWKGTNNWFGVWSWGSGSGQWYKMESVDGTIYSVKVPATHNNIIFVSFPSSASEANWDSKLKQTDDLTISGGNNLYAVSGGWSKYAG